MIIISRARSGWLREEREGSEFALSGVRSTLLGSSLSSEGGGVRGSKGGCVFRGCCCVVGRQRVQRAGGHQKGTSKEGHAASRCFVLGWCRMGAAARRAWGVSVVQTRGVFGSLVEKAGWSVGCSLPLRGGAASYGLPPLLCLGAGPPLVQHRPRVTYSGTAKGPLLGGLPIVSGLEGVCEAWKETERGAESCCLLLKRLERCEGTRKKARHGERGVLLLRWWCSSLPPPCKAWGGL